MEKIILFTNTLKSCPPLKIDLRRQSFYLQDNQRMPASENGFIEADIFRCLSLKIAINKDGRIPF